MDGSEVYRKIVKTVGSLESEVNKYSAEIKKNENIINDFQEKISSAYERMADIYLPELDAKTLKNTINDVKEIAKSVMEKKYREQESLKNSLSSLTKSLDTKNSQLETIVSKVKSQEMIVNDLRNKIVEELNKDEKYKQADLDAKQAKIDLEKNKERLKEMEIERKEELPNYENNKFFSYLKNKNFDKSFATGLIGYLDKKVANLINYESQKKNYDLLSVLPKLMADELSERENNFNSEVKKILQIEKEISDAIGYTKENETLQKIYKDKFDMKKEINSIQENYSSKQGRLSELDSTKDDYFDKAQDVVVDLLKGKSFDELYTLTRNTPTQEDDRLLAIIKDNEDNINEYNKEIYKLKVMESNISSKYQSLVNIKSKFTSRDYEDSDSRFNSINIDSLLSAYVMEKLSADILWHKIESDHSVERRYSSYSGGGFGSGRSSTSSTSSTRRSSSSSSSSGSGFGGFSSGGGFGGGGFSTGGGF
jgi:hypothetical protein